MCILSRFILMQYAATCIRLIFNFRIIYQTQPFHTLYRAAPHARFSFLLLTEQETKGWSCFELCCFVFSTPMEKSQGATCLLRVIEDMLLEGRGSSTHLVE